eukprot:2873008-Rhodomonas_salina.2
MGIDVAGVVLIGGMCGLPLGGHSNDVLGVLLPGGDEAQGRNQDPGSRYQGTIRSASINLGIFKHALCRMDVLTPA